MAAQGDVFRVAVRMTGGYGQDLMNVWHVSITNYSGGTDYDCAEEMVLDLANAYQDFEPTASDDQLSVDMSVQNVTTGTVQGTFAWPVAFAGTATGDNLPSQDSIFCFFRTGVSRRLGRKFLGLVKESLQGNGFTGASVATAVGNFVANFLLSFVGGTTGNTYTYGIYNENKTPQFLAFTEGIHNSNIKTQRRRNAYIGS